LIKSITAINLPLQHLASVQNLCQHKTGQTPKIYIKTTLGQRPKYMLKQQGQVSEKQKFQGKPGGEVDIQIVTFQTFTNSFSFLQYPSLNFFTTQKYEESNIQEKQKL
jgi:hypothetical protein